MNQLFPELPPPERIPKIVEEYLFPQFERCGFTLLKSGLTIKKKDRDFTYELNIYKNHRNIGNAVCAFEVWASVSSPTYNRWYKTSYEHTLLNTKIISSRIESIPHSTLDPFPADFDLALHDNVLMVTVIQENIESSILPFLFQISSWQTAILAVQKEKEYFKTPMLLDFCEMVRDEELGRATLCWFSENTDRADYDHIEDELSIREARLRKGYP